MFNMDFNVQIGKNNLALLNDVEIRKSVDSLADIAKITIPGVIHGEVVNISKYVNIGDRVKINLGYSETGLKREFEGYLQRIEQGKGLLKLHCEDDIHLTRKAIEPKQFNNPTIQQIVIYCAKQAGMEYNCSFNTTSYYEKFVIPPNVQIFDILKKLQNETKANIYIRNGVLNAHPLYIEKHGKVIYDFAVNIETADLSYRNTNDKKTQVVINTTGLNGKKRSYTAGTPGGDIINATIPNMTDDAMKEYAQNVLKAKDFTGYEGNITGWLIPFVEPGYSCEIRDSEQEYKKGIYFVETVETSFSENGGVNFFAS